MAKMRPTTTGYIAEVLTQVHTGPITEKHRRCPTCYGTQRGAGIAYSTRGLKRYYKCPKCGMTWAVEFDNAGLVFAEVKAVSR